MRRADLPKSAMMFLARLLLVIVGLFLLPLGAHALWWSLREDVAPNYRQADWSSASLLPLPATAPDAIVAVYAARVGRWRGIFAHHTWVVVKEAGADRYTRYDKVGWGSPVRTNGWAPDGRWFGNAPQPIVLIEGEAAQGLIPQIQAAVASYPYRVSGDYHAWPGPNSNTFVAHVMRSVPELGAALPPTALGKNWQPFRDIVGLTPRSNRCSDFPRRLCGRRGRVGRGHRVRFPGPRRRHRHPPPGPEAPRLGTDRNAADRLVKTGRERAKAGP